MAVICCVEKRVRLGSAGVTVMDVTVAFVTCSDVFPVIPASEAPMVTLPMATPVTMPLRLAALLIEAMLMLVEVHVTWEVRFCVVLSE